MTGGVVTNHPPLTPTVPVAGSLPSSPGPNPNQCSPAQQTGPEQRPNEENQVRRFRHRIGRDGQGVQRHIRPACRNIVGDEE
jgi:hypothetical protein